ncbi:MAG: tyrosine-type recombinase/integrase [Nitrososphaerota archaeon]|nr:tyrosine-type recombinase/integrase [Nitrososphaerota archaeon]
MLDWGKTDQFIEGIYRRSHSVHSKHFYSFGIRKVRQFIEEKNVRLTQANLYDTMDEFVGWLDAQGLKPKTIVDYNSTAKRFLVFCGFEIDEKKFRNKVSTPRVMKIVEEPLKMEQVGQLLTVGKPNARMRALILVLLSSGMRFTEALSLTVKDLDLKVEPARATLRAEITKGKRARVAYMSDEAKEAVSEIVRSAPSDRFVFDYSGDIWSRNKIATMTFRRVVARAGLGARLDYHRIHKIHFHLFRKYFLTKGSDVIGEHAAHAPCGHGFHLDTYYQKSEEERTADYLRLMPHLSVFGGEERTDLKTEFKREILLKVGGYKKEEVDALDLVTMEDQEIQKMVRERLLGAMTNNGHQQKVTPASEVEDFLAKGWEYVAALPDGKVVLKLPN